MSSSGYLSYARGEVPPAAIELMSIGLSFHWLQWIVDALAEAPLLFIFADIQKVFEQDDAALDHCRLKTRCEFKEPFGLFLRTEAHHALDTRPIIPGSVENHDFASSRELLDIALHVDLRLLPVRRCWQSDDAEDARADALGESFDDAAFTGRVAPLENNDYAGTGLFHPGLEMGDFLLQRASSFA